MFCLSYQYFCWNVFLGKTNNWYDQDRLKIDTNKTERCEMWVSFNVEWKLFSKDNSADIHADPNDYYFVKWFYHISSKITLSKLKCFFKQVGSLAALHLAKKGHDVHLYEYREGTPFIHDNCHNFKKKHWPQIRIDIRTAELVQGRSINLALSVRGRKALAQVGLEEKLLEHGIPMRGRMLHDLNGRTQTVPYDANTNQVHNSNGV